MHHVLHVLDAPACCSDNSDQFIDWQLWVGMVWQRCWSSVKADIHGIFW